MSSENILANFIRTISGKYSNQEQAQTNPKYFAHINIYFRRIYQPILKGIWLYSEQSYDYDKWSPYKQTIHKLSRNGDIFVFDNYKLKDPKRVAGAGFMPELLCNIDFSLAKERDGCAMHFKELGAGNYIGSLEPGRKCLIARGGELTYLVSHVEFNEKELISLDQGYSVSTNQKIWGSDHGAILFKKVIH